MSTVCQRESEEKSTDATVVALVDFRLRKLADVIAGELRVGHGSTIHAVDKVDDVELWRKAARRASRLLGVPVRTGLAPDGSRVWAVDNSSPSIGTHDLCGPRKTAVPGQLGGAGGLNDRRVPNQSRHFWNTRVRTDLRIGARSPLEVERSAIVLACVLCPWGQLA
jgi:hypothetical protein